MKQKYHFEIPYYDVDNTRHLRLTDLERYLLEAAGNAADSLGLGTNAILEKYNTAWVLTRLSVQMDYLPVAHDELIIETWIEGNAHMLSMRNFRLYIVKNEHEYKIGEGASIWTLLNLDTRLVDVKAFADPVWERCIDGEKVSLGRAARMGRIEQPTSSMPHTIRYSDLDFNNHCNSAKYLQFMLNADDRLTGTYPVRLDINYAKEVYKGDATHVDVLATNDENGDLKSLQYCIVTPGDEVSCTALITKM